MPRDTCSTEGCGRSINRNGNTNSESGICYLCRSKLPEKVEAHRRIANNYFKRKTQENREYRNEIKDFRRMQEMLLKPDTPPEIPVKKPAEPRVYKERKFPPRKGRKIKMPKRNICTMAVYL